MTSTMYLGLPREEIAWYPTIDLEKCNGCKICTNNCKHDVYTLEGDPARPKVVNPYNCLVGCEACAKLCPMSAIRFPSRDELKRMLKEARAKHGFEAAAIK